MFPATAAAPTQWDRAWVRALDDLELDVAAAERLLGQVHAGVDAPRPDLSGRWTPPSGLGPLPASLRERATALLHRQIEAARAVTVELGATRRHAVAVQAMSVRPEARPLFVDRAM
jgi:hypothetical protein